MGELEQMKEMVHQLIQENAKVAQENAKMAQEGVQQKQDINRLIAALAEGRQQPGNHAPPPDAAALRLEKLAKMGLALRKSSKVKDFKDTQESNIREWLKRFDQEVTQLKKMSGIADELQREEYVDLIKDKLDFAVLKRLDTAFPTRNPVLRWDQVTKDQLHKCLKDEFGSKETDVSSVLLQFGPNRLKKTPEMSVGEFYHLWQDQLPTCMLPTTNDERTKYVDLINRSLFYFSLEDKFLQEQISNLKDDDPTLKKFFDEAVIAEQKRKSFQEIGVSSSQLDSSGGVAVNKYEVKGGKQGSRGKWDKSGFSSGENLQKPGQRNANPPATTSAPNATAATTTTVTASVKWFYWCQVKEEEWQVL